MPFLARIALLLLSLPMVLHAENIEEMDNTLIPKGAVLEEESWMMATELDIRGVVQDDLFFLAKEALLSGTFEDDIWGVGINISYSGRSEQDIRLAARDLVRFSGQTTDNLTAIGIPGSVNISTNAVVGGSVYLVGKNVVVSGKINGPAKIMGSQVTINGEIGGDVSITSQDIKIMPEAVFGGNITYIGKQSMVLDKRVQIEGELIKGSVTKKGDASGSRSILRSGLVKTLFFLASLLTGIVWITVLPGYVMQSVEYIRLRRTPCMLIGAVMLIALPFLGNLFLVSIIGLPLGLMMLAGFGTLLYMGKIITALAIGVALLRSPNPFRFLNLLLSLLMGLLIVFLVTSLPMVGQILWFILSFLGMGAMILSVVQSQLIHRSKPPALPVPEGADDENTEESDLKD